MSEINVFGYARQRPNEEISERLEEIYNFCKEKNLNLVQVYVESSMYKTPDFILNRMLADYESRDVDVEKIITRDISDLGRTTTDAIKRLESLLHEQEVRIIFIERYLDVTKEEDYRQLLGLIESFHNARENKNKIPKKKRNN